MFGSSIIVFRETLEAALIIGIIAAATRGIGGRGRMLAGGVLAGLAGSLLVAALTERIAQLAEGAGQELFNAGVLGVAVLMLAWHNIWMARHGREMAAAARGAVAAVRDGRHELAAVGIVIALAVLREGSETTLFLYGLLAAGEGSIATVAGGGAAGLAAGGAAGYALYAGFVRLPVRTFFTATSALILLLAAALASQMARFLVQADLLPSLASPAWDTSAILPNASPPGVLLHTLAGYDATPTGMQVIFYGVTAVAILIGMRLARPTPSRFSASATSVS